MSTVLAIIYNGKICMASDTMATDHETGEELEPSTKQIVINDEIAIGFAGSGNIAETIMKTLAHKRNKHIVSKLNINEIPKVLDETYKALIAKRQYPDEETRHVSALIIGANNHIPEIICWESDKAPYVINQNHPDNFTAYVLPPYDMDRNACNKIVWKSAKEHSECTSPLKYIATDYFKVISSMSKFVSNTANIWIQTFIPRKSQIVWNGDIRED